MYEDYMADNAAEEAEQTANEAPQTDDGAAAVEDKRTETKAFSDRLNRMSTARVNDFVASMGITNPYTGEQVRTAEQYHELQQMQRADENGTDPQTAAQLMRLSAELNGYKQKEEDAQLSADPVLSKYYNQYREELIAVQQAERANGNDLSLAMLLNARIAADIPAILADMNNNVQTAAVNQMRNNAAASPGSAGGAPTGNSYTYATMPEADFDRALRAALNGDLKRA